METIVRYRERTATVELPAGYYRVLSECPKVGDRYLSATTFVYTGLISWCDLTIVHDAYTRGDDFLCLIRVGTQVDRLCPKCNQKAIERGYLYCHWCCDEIIDENREQV